MDVLEGAEPASYPGGRHGALVLHGFTGSPQSMRGLAEVLAGAGFTVELPLLPGHGTSIDDMEGTRFADWLGAAEAAYADLAARVDDVIVVGLSMGGTLAVTLALNHPEIIGVIVVNPFITPPEEAMVSGLRGMVAAGTRRAPGIASDIAAPGVTELGYTETPLEALLSLIDAAADLPDRLPDLRAPVLLFSSPQDHVVPPESGDVLAAKAGGPVERVILERSYHVATLDHDRGEIERRAVEFAQRIAGD